MKGPQQWHQIGERRGWLVVRRRIARGQAGYPWLKHIKRFSLRLVGGVMLLAVPVRAADEPAPLIPVGVAKVDITPTPPIWLTGYNDRPTETTEVRQRLFARAIAIGRDADGPAVLIAVEAAGITEAISDAVAAVLKESHGIERARVALVATHIHTGPAIGGLLPYMYSRDLPAEEEARIKAYTAHLQARLIEVAKAALASRQPARLSWGEGSASFAIQRRQIENGEWVGFGAVPGGPVDHALPVLRVTDQQSRVRAIFVSYACHCTTLKGADNFIHPDWAGEASAQLEAAYPAAIVLVGIGCGADANPRSRDGLASVAEHGAEITAEVERLLSTPLRPLGTVTGSRYRRTALPLDRPVSREELEMRLDPSLPARESYAAQKFIELLDAGRALPAAVPYPVQTWSFGRDLVMVFLAGEVVAEYSLRLRRELDSSRLWVNAYANSMPCYIASASMYPEGGYEVDQSMHYYGWPTRLARGTEDRVIGLVHDLVPEDFSSSH